VATRTTRENRRDGEELVDSRFLKAMSHAMRVRIMVELDRAPMSPSEYFEEFGGGSLEKISYHFRFLERCECIRLVDVKTRRGVPEHFYENTKQALFDEQQFSALPASVRSSFSAQILSTFMDRAAESLVARTLDSHQSRHLTWEPLELDEEGFADLMSRLDAIHMSLPDEQEKAWERLDASGETPILTTVAMFAFQSPKPDRDHDLPPRRVKPSR
jgi:hypothetical protein